MPDEGMAQAPGQRTGARQLGWDQAVLGAKLLIEKDGSVPNVLSLLTPPNLRPKTFSVRDAGEEFRFDQNALGLNLIEGHLEVEGMDFTAEEDAELLARTRYNTEEVGHSNQGHPFGLTLSPDEKSQLIEYLKTL